MLYECRFLADNRIDRVCYSFFLVVHSPLGNIQHRNHFYQSCHSCVQRTQPYRRRWHALSSMFRHKSAIDIFRNRRLCTDTLPGYRCGVSYAFRRYN